MSCLMFNGSYMCTEISVNESQLCHEHDCKKIVSDTCNICLGEMKEYIFVKCGHSFHKECIFDWLLKKQTCPCCRIDIKLETNQQNINEYGTSTKREFVYWFFENTRKYVNVTDICLLDMLYVIQQQHNQFNYYMTVYLNQKNNIYINLFELKLKLNQIADYLRSNSNIHYEEDEEDEEDDEDEEEEEDEDDEDDDNDNNLN